MPVLRTGACSTVRIDADHTEVRSSNGGGHSWTIK